MVKDFLCFDTESAQGRYKGVFIEELIEISVMNAAGDEVFYHRFKPTRLSRWDTSIHHITPEMVVSEPHVNSLKEEIQQLFNSTEYIVGFSLIDDFKAASKAGITGLDLKRHIELRHLYWYCIGRHNNVPFYSGPGLSYCAEELGVAVIKDAVHTANGDTRVTLNLFFELMKRFSQIEGLGDDIPDADTIEFIDLVEFALRRIKEAKYEYDRTVAAGYMHITKHEDGGYRFISTTRDIDYKDGSVLTIPVNARRRAAFELEKKFAKRRILNTRSFRLTRTDLEKIKTYTNEFDNQEQMYQRLLGLQRNMASMKS